MHSKGLHWDKIDELLNLHTDSYKAEGNFFLFFIKTLYLDEARFISQVPLIFCF